MSFFLLSTSSYADSDGYGCYGKGVVAFENAFSDPTGLYVIRFGNNEGISEKIRVEFPRRHGPNLRGITCEEDRVALLMRIQNKNNIKKYHLTEIVINDNTDEISIISDGPVRYHNFEKDEDKTFELLNENAMVEEFPSPDFWLTGCNRGRGERIKLTSADKNNTFYLNFIASYTQSEISNEGRSIITHRCISNIEMENIEGEIIQKLEISDRESFEPIH